MATDVRVECLTAMSAGASTLASRTPFMLHRWLRPDAPEMLAAMVRHRLEQAIASHGSQAWCASAGREVSAVAVLQPLPWDSNVLETSAGRIELIAAGDYAERRAGVAAVLRSALAAATAAGMRHVSVRVDAADDAGIHELESRGFLNVDALVTFGRHVDAPVDASVSRGARVRPLAAEDRQAVGEIAADAFREGRFHADPDISPEAARRVYRSWAAACCDGVAADAVLVAGDLAGVQGFVACRMQQDTAVYLQRPAGTIVLIAAAAASRGRGVGVELIAAAMAWFAEQRAVAVEVGTQLRNVAAARLYERCGFRQVAGALSFRITIEK